MIFENVIYLLNNETTFLNEKIFTKMKLIYRGVKTHTFENFCGGHVAPRHLFFFQGFPQILENNVMYNTKLTKIMKGISIFRITHFYK